MGDIRTIDWNTMRRKCNGFHEYAAKPIEAITVLIVDKHVPMETMSSNKKKQLTKPWITNGVLKSIRAKQKMHKTHFLSNNA